jgi:hypothetical protein
MVAAIASRQRQPDLRLVNHKVLPKEEAGSRSSRINYGCCCRWYRKSVGVVAVVAFKGSGRAAANLKRESLPAIPQSIFAEHDQRRWWRDRCQSVAIADQRPDVDVTQNAGRLSSIYSDALIATARAALSGGVSVCRTKSTSWPGLSRPSAFSLPIQS